jgi:hypothetical protein
MEGSIKGGTVKKNDDDDVQSNTISGVPHFRTR